MSITNSKAVTGLLLAFVISLIFGCGGGGGGGSGGDDDTRNQNTSSLSYVVATSISTSGTGVITGEGSYVEGQSATLTATANPGYVFSHWEEDGALVSSNNPYTFAVNSGRTLVAVFDAVDPCVDADGNEHNLAYQWSLATNLVTLTNNNQCDIIFVWAASTPLCDRCTNEIDLANISVAPGETVELPAAQPMYPSWKPVVIYSTANGHSYYLYPGDGGSWPHQHVPIILLDFSDEYIGQIPEYEQAYIIDQIDYETVRGDCYAFSWLDRDNGHFQIAPDATRKTAYCMIGNNTGYTESGDFFMHLPNVNYFVTDLSAGPN